MRSCRTVTSSIEPFLVSALNGVCAWRAVWLSRLKRRSAALTSINRKKRPCATKSSSCSKSITFTALHSQLHFTTPHSLPTPPTLYTSPKMSISAPPPSRHISSIPISLTTASQMLTTYITNSESHAHLHPDSSITPEGISFSSKGGPEGNVVMHNLRRIAAGMRGEYMAPEKTPEPEDDEDAEGRSFSNKKRKTVLNDDWQDKAEYEREEGLIEVGEIGDRSNFVQEGGEEPAVEVTAGAQEGGAKKRKIGGKSRAGLTDKEARKLAKQEKQLQRKRDKAQESANKNQD